MVTSAIYIKKLILKNKKMVDKGNKKFWWWHVINAENEQIKHQKLNSARKNQKQWYIIWPYLTVFKNFIFFIYSAFDKLINAEDE